MKKKYLKIIIPILIVAVISTVIIINKRSRETIKGNNFEGNTAVIKRGNIETYITGHGNISSYLIKSLKARSDGSIGETYVKEGQRVAKGDVILSFNNETDDISISQNSLEVAQQEKEIARLREKAEHLTVIAPYSGSINKMLFEEGDEVADNQDFVNIIDNTVLEVVVPFNKHLIRNINVGDEVKVFFPDSFQNIKGKVTKISDTSYGTELGGVLFDVTVEIDNVGAMKDGTEVSVHVDTPSGTISSFKNGKLEWKLNKSVKFKIDGTIDKIYIEEGQKVKKGDVIAKLKNEDFLLQIETKEGQLKNQKMELNKKRKELDDSVIYSPITGTLVNMDVVSGENVASEQVLGKIADLENLQVTISVDELDILRVKEGQKAVIKVSSVKKKDFKGYVEKISQEGKIENGVASYDVNIRFDKDEDLEELKLGMSSNVEIELDSKKDTLIVPIEFLKKEDEQYYINLQSEDGENQRLDVEIGLVSNDYAEILSDLKEGDIVVK